MHGVKKSALLVAGSLCLAAMNFAAAQTKAPAKAPEFLFVQTAKNVAYKDGVLTLQDVSPVTVFFSDRPKRIVGNVRNDLFLKKWTEGRRQNDCGEEQPEADHSITSSARVSSAGGMVIPSTFTALRLITSSNLIGC